MGAAPRRPRCRPDFDLASHLGRPLTSSDVLTASQELCERGSTSPSMQVRRCPELPAPRIETPRAGDTFVIVADAVPATPIRVYDAASNETGDGSGGAEDHARGDCVSVERVLH